MTPTTEFASNRDDFSPAIIEHTAVVDARPADVWRLWTTTEGITEWLCSEARIELEIGGAYEVYFVLDAPPGDRGSERCRVMSFVPQEMLSFSWNAPPIFGDERFRHTWVVLDFCPRDGGTSVRLRHLGWPASGMAGEGRWTEVYAYFEAAWGRVLANLIAHCAPGAAVGSQN